MSSGEPDPCPMRVRNGLLPARFRWSASARGRSALSATAGRAGRGTCPGQDARPGGQRPGGHPKPGEAQGEARQAEQRAKDGRDSGGGRSRRDHPRTRGRRPWTRPGLTPSASGRPPRIASPKPPRHTPPRLERARAVAAREPDELRTRPGRRPSRNAASAVFLFPLAFYNPPALDAFLSCCLSAILGLSAVCARPFPCPILLPSPQSKAHRCINNDHGQSRSNAQDRPEGSWQR
jgi:hypothetical protein